MLHLVFLSFRQVHQEGEKEKVNVLGILSPFLIHSFRRLRFEREMEKMKSECACLLVCRRPLLVLLL